MEAEDDEAANPFRPSLKTARSPGDKRSIDHPQQEKRNAHSPAGKVLASSSSAATQAANAPQIRIDVPVSTTAILNTGVSDGGSNTLQADDPLDNLGSKLGTLLGIMNSQRHVNQSMKDLVASMAEEVKRAIRKYRECRIPKIDEIQVQRERVEEISSRQSQTNTQAPRSQRKKNKQQQQRNKRNIHNLQHAQNAVASNSAREDPETQHQDGSSSNLQSQQAGGAQWTVVNRKRPANKVKPVRPEAIILQKKGETTYADMLKMIKTNQEMEELGSEVNKIRRTAKGELMLILKRGPEASAGKHIGNMSTLLQNVADVHVLSQQTTIECRDLDEITTATDICAAIVKQFPTIGNISSSVVKRIRITRDGTYTALVTLPTRQANILLKAERIRIGWVSSRIRICAQPIRCYKCLEYGHVSKYCRSEIDRTGMCLKCGNPGHKAKTCKGTPRCLLCPAGDNQHEMVDKNCPVYQAARKKLQTNG